jgi:hypothetical protein
MSDTKTVELRDGTSVIGDCPFAQTHAARGGVVDNTNQEGEPTWER